MLWAVEVEAPADAETEAVEDRLPEPAEADNREVVVVQETGGPATLMLPPVVCAICTGNLEKEPGNVETDTHVHGGTMRAPGPATTVTSLLKLN